MSKVIEQENEIVADRAKATPMFRYADSYGFRNGDATIVFGQHSLRTRGRANALAEVVNKLASSVSVLANGVVETKGVAKATVEDGYNREIGVELASLRAESASNNAVRAAVKDVLALATELVDLLSAELVDLETRKAEIKTKIADLSNR